VLLAVPNFSEGADDRVIEEITAAFSRGVELLDRHSDAVHNRTVLTLAGEPDALAAALGAGAAACVERLDIYRHAGAHPHIGTLDVCPLVYLRDADRDRAAAAAVATAEAIAALEVPVFFYGELATAPERAERAYFRRGGPPELGRRMHGGDLASDLGPAEPHKTAGATLVTARRPLAAFNLLLDTDDAAIAVAIAERLREANGGLPGVRAIGIDLEGRAQVSTNVHDPVAVPLATVIERVRELAAEHGARPVEGELIGLVPEAAARDLPADVPLAGFEPERHLIERRL
jgi:glutamate formiminotransferase